MMISRKIPLSVAIITRNEEKMLTDCLESVMFADDIVVVDSGSTDRTVQIAEQFNCRVYSEEWKGFGPQKTSAVEKCRHDWVLILDADERIPEETREAIIKAIGGNAPADAYSLPRKAYFNGRWIKHCGWWPDEIVRLFRRGKGSVSARAVHEYVEVKGVTMRLSGPIIHYPMRNISAVIEKINTYSSLGAEELFRAGRNSSGLDAFLHGFGSFTKSYFLKLGVLDGKEGFFISLTGAVTTFYKYAKLQELNRKNG
ncbi:MAG: glycosyltransferase family 2 protein [Nitrospiraceae bacterium]|nr:glycosyltransferase family 2 protein [Nitrospiraceae bacterium]